MNNQLFEEVREDYLNYLSAVVQGSKNISLDLREDKIVVAMNKIKDFSEGIGWLISSNELLKANGYGFATVDKELVNFLDEINEGLDVKDFVLVADIFEYEIAPFFETYLANCHNPS